MTVTLEILEAADTCYVLGNNLSRWIVDYVDLEESLAVGSISQDLFAHAALLYELANFDDVERDRLIFQRAPSDWQAWRLVSFPTSSWIGAVIQNWIFNKSLLHWLGFLQLKSSDHGDEVIGIIEAEQRIHSAHWLQWMILLSAGDSTRPDLEKWIATYLELAGNDKVRQSVDDTSITASRSQIESWLAEIGHKISPPPGFTNQLSATEIDSEFVTTIETMQSLRSDPELPRRIYR